MDAHGNANSCSQWFFSLRSLASAGLEKPLLARKLSQRSASLPPFLFHMYNVKFASFLVVGTLALEASLKFKRTKTVQEG